MKAKDTIYSKENIERIKQSIQHLEEGKRLQKQSKN